MSTPGRAKAMAGVMKTEATVSVGCRTRRLLVRPSTFTRRWEIVHNRSSFIILTVSAVWLETTTS